MQVILIQFGMPAPGCPQDDWWLKRHGQAMAAHEEDVLRLTALLWNSGMRLSPLDGLRAAGDFSACAALAFAKHQLCADLVSISLGV